MKPEARLWNYLKRKIGGKWAADRIEVNDRSGVPDVNFSLDGVGGWIELKAVKMPKRDRTHVKFAHFTPSQRTWLINRSRFDNRIFLVARIGDVIALFGACSFQHLGEKTRLELKEEALGWYESGLDVEDFLSILRKGDETSHSCDDDLDSLGMRVVEELSPSDN